MTFEEFNNKFGGENFYYVYEHKLAGEVFYIGKGRGPRAIDFERRNVFWKRYVKGRVNHVEVDLVAFFEKEEDSFLFEENLIYKYLSLGKDLCNINYNLNLPNNKEKKIKLNAVKDILNPFYIEDYQEMLLCMKSEIKKGRKILLISDKTKVFYDKMRETFENALFFNPYENPMSKEEFSDELDLIVIPSSFIDYVGDKFKNHKDLTVILNVTSKSRTSKALDLIEKDSRIFVRMKPEGKCVSPEGEIKIPSEYLNKALRKKDRDKLSKELGFFCDGKFYVGSWNKLKRELIKEDSGYSITESLISTDNSRDRAFIIRLIENKKANKMLEAFISEIEIPEKFIDVKLTKNDRDELCKELNIINNNGYSSKWKTIKALINTHSNRYIIEDGLANINKVRTRYSLITLKTFT